MSDVIPAANGALLSFIERASRDPDFDVAKFGELLRLQRDVTHDQARRAFNAAMSDAQSEMLPVVRDAKNSHLNNRYAKLETIDAAIRPIYTKHGFSVRYGSAPASEGLIRITCTVAHSGGYFEENYLDAPLGTTCAQGNRTATTPVQGVGSAVTYLRRYLLGMVFNVVLSDEDDDGVGAGRAVASPGVRAPVKRGPVAYTDEQWQAWLVKTRSAMAVMRTLKEVEEAAARESVKNAEDNGPEWVKRDVGEILADAYARFVTKPEPPTEDDGAAAHEPETEAASV